MEIAFCMSKEFLETGGGGRVQILKTKEYLERIDSSLNIYFAHSVNEISENTDVVHIFNLADLDLNLEFIARAKTVGAKSFLSTIYWDYSYLILTGEYSRIFGYNYSSFIFHIEKLIGKISAFFTGRPEYFSKNMRKKYKSVISNVDYLLPNSVEEGEKLIAYIEEDFDVFKQKIFPVVNAVEIDSEKSEAIDCNFSLPKNYVLEVGRIEPAKNQYKLVKALLKDDIPIVFLGRDYFPNSKYSKKLHKLSVKRGNVFFFDQVSYQQVPYFYRNAGLHILPSLRESPGLVSLEAQLNMCKVIVSDKRFTPIKTYFLDDVVTVNPLSSKSIRDNILKELSMKKDLKRNYLHTKNNFTWNKTAEQTLEAYKSAGI